MAAPENSPKRRSEQARPGFGEAASETRASRGLSLRFLRPLERAIARAGLAAPAFVASPQDAPDVRITAGALAKALDDLAARTNRPALGLDLAREMPLGALGILDYCVSTSSTLGEALARIARHLTLVDDAATFDVAVRGDACVARFVCDAPHGRPLNELALALLAIRCGAALGEPLALAGVRFAHAAPASTAAYDAFFGVDVTFGAREDGISFARALLDQPLVGADPALARLLDDHASTLAPRTGRLEPLLDRARAAITACLTHGAPGLRALAAQMGMRPRTLQRKLREHATSCSALVEDVQRAVATDLLGGSEMSLKEVAFRAGFRDVSAFYRAFRRWTGTTPRAFRSDRAAHSCGASRNSFWRELQKPRAY